MWGCGLGLSGVGYQPVVGCYDSELCGFVSFSEVLDFKA